MADRRVKVIVEAEIGNYRKSMEDAGNATEGLAKSTDKLGPATDKAAGRFGKLSAAVALHSDDMNKVGTSLIGVGAGLTAMAVGAGKAAMDWESSWAGVTKTTDGTAEEMAELEGGLRNLAKTLPSTHTEIAAVAEAAGQLGVAREDVVGFTSTMIDLGETTNLTADEAATNIAQISNVMGTMEREGSVGVERFGAALVALGNDGASTEAEILNMAQRIAGAGATLGATEADVLALSNTLASMGVRAELGGGVATRVLLKMRTAVDEGGDSLATFAEVAGVSADEFAVKFREAPVEALGLVSQGIHGVNEAGGNVTATLKDMGIKGTEETQVMLALANSGDLLTDSLKLGAQAWEDNSALAEEAAKRYETTEAQIAIAWNQIKDAAIDAGGALLPIVATFADGAAAIASAFVGLPDPVKGALGVLAGVGGVTLLAAGGLLKLAPAAFETMTAFQNLAKASPGAIGGLKTFGKVAGGLAGGAVAATALVTGLTALYNSTKEATPSVEELANALLKLEDTGDMGNIDEMFQFSSVTTRVDGFVDAVGRLDLSNPVRHIQSFGDTVMGVDNPLSEVRDTLVALDQTLATMDADKAAQQVDRLRMALEIEGDDSLSHWNNLKEMFPEYAASVTEAANATYGAVDDADLLMLALGDIPPHLEAVGDAGGEAGEGAADAGEGMDEAAAAAEELADQLKEALDGLREMGIVPRNAQAANDAYKQSLNDLTQSIKDNGATLDDNTEKGLANRQALRDHTDAGLENAAAMAEVGASSGEISGALMDTYNSLVENADAMGLSRTEAELYAKELLGIPTDVNVESWMSDEAAAIAELTGATIGEIPERIQVLAIMSPAAQEQAFKTAEAIKTIPGYKRVDVAVDDQGTPGQIQSRVNAITGKTEYVFVTDDGTVNATQTKITGIDGKTEYVYVTDNGTVVSTQKAINNINGKSVTITAKVNDYDAKARLDALTGPRSATIRVRMRQMGQAELAQGGIAGLGNLPRRSHGGRLPSYGKGTDTILGVNSAGTPTAWVDDGEMVVRRSSTEKHLPLLMAINRDEPWVSKFSRMRGLAGGGSPGREWSGSSMSPQVSVMAPGHAGPTAGELAAAVASQLPTALAGMRVVLDGRATIGELKQHRAWTGAS